MIQLILTSDDFGMSPLYDQKMVEFIEVGYLSSISILVERARQNSAIQLDSILRMYKERDLSLGLHLEIKGEELLRACETQWHNFADLCGLPPDYIDIHKEHASSGIYDAIANFCLIKDVCFRKYHQTNLNVRGPSSCLQSVNSELNLITEWIDGLPDSSISELVFHIGTYDPGCKSSLNRQREVEGRKLETIYRYARTRGVEITSYRSITAGDKQN